MGTQGALVHTTQGGIRYAAYYAQGGQYPFFTGGEATNNSGSGLSVTYCKPVGEGLLLAGPLQYVKCQSEKFQIFSENL